MTFTWRPESRKMMHVDEEHEVGTSRRKCRQLEV